jgi:hypothetical protein
MLAQEVPQVATLYRLSDQGEMERLCRVSTSPYDLPDLEVAERVE